MAVATMDQTAQAAHKVARDVARDPEGASVADLLTAIKHLTYVRGSLILTARRRGAEDAPRTQAREAKIAAQLTRYAALVDAKR
jgi:hypothetical protein